MNYSLLIILILVILLIVCLNKNNENFELNTYKLPCKIPNHKIDIGKPSKGVNSSLLPCYSHDEEKTIINWGINSKGDIAKYDPSFNCPGICKNPQWQKIAGNLKDISQDKTHIWGVNKSGHIYKCAKPCKGSWTKVSGSDFKQISPGNTYIWGITNSKDMYKCRKPCNGKWQLVKRGVDKKIIVDKKNKDGKIVKIAKIVKTDTTGGLKNISAKNPQYLWGVNNSDVLYKCKKPCNNGNWIKIPGRLKVVSGSNNELWGVNSGDNIYKCKEPCSGSWKHIPGKLKHVSADGKKYVWGVNKNNGIYKCKKPCNGNWEHVKGSLEKIE